MSETHVLAIALRFHGAVEHHALFRGDERECVMLGKRITCCSDDRRPVQDMQLEMMTVPAWEEYLSSMRQ